MINDNLHSLNLATNTSTLIAPLGINIQFAQDADTDRDTNILYMAAYVGASVGQGKFASVNKTTGAATIIGEWVPATAGEIVEFAAFSISNTIPATFMAINETKTVKEAIYPNPTTGIIHFETKEKVETVDLV